MLVEPLAVDQLQVGTGRSEAFVKPPPVPSTRLLGRAEDLGTGKTRFAIELFQRLAPGYAVESPGPKAPGARTDDPTDACVEAACSLP